MAREKSDDAREQLSGKAMSRQARLAGRPSSNARQSGSGSRAGGGSSRGKVWTQGRHGLDKARGQSGPSVGAARTCARADR